MSKPLKQRLREFWRKQLRPFALMILVLTSFRSAVADWNDVPTGSMRPTIIEGDRIFVNKLAYGMKVPFTTIHLARWDSPQRGEVVVFFSPVDGTRLVKRVVGLPGDVIRMQDNRLFINGAPVLYDAQGAMVRERLGNHDHVIESDSPVLAMRTFEPVTIGPREYFVMGDNRNNSHDSRYFGTVSIDQIVGRSSDVILSLDYDDYYLPRWERFFKALD